MSILISLVVLCVFVQSSYCMRIDTGGSESAPDSVSKNKVRCYCNLPECITTSYMCKSEGLGCFSDILAYIDVNRASHGCLDLLEREKQEQCRNEPSSPHVAGTTSPHVAGTPRSLLLCCYRDLCNHVDNPETLQRLNDSVIASSLVTDVERNVMVVNTRLRHSPGYTNAEVWFRAATIAVPICGALILFILIALAIRILQSDAIDDRVLASKLRAKHCGFSPISLDRPNYGHHLQNSTMSYVPVADSTIKKVPFLFHDGATDTTLSPVPFTGCLNRLTNYGQGVNVLHSCQQKRKNEANAKLNLTQIVSSDSVMPVVAPVHTTEPATNLIDLQKSSSPCNNNCNIYHQEESPDDLHPACALLPAAPHKLTYKKPLVISWTDADIKVSNSQ